MHACPCLLGGTDLLHAVERGQTVEDCVRQRVGLHEAVDRQDHEPRVVLRDHPHQYEVLRLVPGPALPRLRRTLVAVVEGGVRPVVPVRDRHV